MIWSRASRVGVAFLVNQVCGGDAVGSTHDVAEERRRIAVGGVVSEHATVEGVSQQRAIGRESLPGAPSVVVEPIGQHLQPVSIDPLPNGGRVVGVISRTPGSSSGSEG